MCNTGGFRHRAREFAREFPTTGSGFRTPPRNTSQVTGDFAMLDEVVPFLDGAPLRSDEHESFFQPTISKEHGSLFEHCARAFDTSLTVGAHGLPLIGTGDWNDGLNRVGVGGKGESIWLGWFLHSTLSAFAPLADRRGEQTRATSWRQHATKLAASLEENGWDGGWYRRAYFDDGTPLGAAFRRRVPN